MKRAALLLAFAAASCCVPMSRRVDRTLAVAPDPARAARAQAPLHEVRVERTVWHDAVRNRDVPATIYVPSGSAPSPVVIFSHGIGEDRDSYEYLGRGLAGRGYLTVALTHFGTDKSVLQRGYLHLYRATKDLRNWVNRPLDVRFAIDQLPVAQRRRSRTDRGGGTLGRRLHRADGGGDAHEVARASG
jgi:Predicted dienelactone hydrolase